MNSTSKTKKLIAAAASAAALTGAFFAPSAAFAASCPTGSTLVTPGVCEVVFTSTPSAPWTPPVGASHLEALLVGGGGSGEDVYAGGGGDVRVVSLASTGDVTVTVGVAGSGAYSSSQDSRVVQGQTDEVALGGQPGVYLGSAGASGNGNAGAIEFVGGGAGSAAFDRYNAGSGARVYDITEAGSLFADSQECLGAGGAYYSLYSLSPTDYRLLTADSNCGGVTYTLTSATPDPGPDGTRWIITATGDTDAQSKITVIPPADNSGAGASRSSSFGTVSGTPAAAGKVVLRFNYTAPQSKLADTGSSAFAPSAFAAGVAALGAVLVSVARRRKNA